MNDFKDIMSNRTDAELVEITTALRNEYQMDAVIAAENELLIRNLSEQQLSDAKSKLDIKQLNQEKQKEKQKEKIKILQKSAITLAEVLNPIKQKSTETTVKLVTVLFTISYLLYFFKNWDLTFLMLSDINETDLSSLEYFAPMILFPVGFIGFWFMKKMGWIILTMMFTYSTVTKIITSTFELIVTMKYCRETDNSGPFTIQSKGFTTFDYLYGKEKLVLTVMQILIFIALIIFLNRRIIREKFKISRWIQWLTIGLTATPLIIYGLTMLNKI